MQTPPITALWPDSPKAQIALQLEAGRFALTPALFCIKSLFRREKKYLA